MRGALPVMLAAGSLCLPLAQAAALYKWVDDKGVTQYTETPPPDGRAAKKIEVQPAPPIQPGKDDWRQRELESKQRHIKEDQQRDQDALVAGQRHERCLRAQEEIDRLNKGIPLYHVNERGERVYLDDAERARQLAGWTQRAQESCD